MSYKDKYLKYKTKYFSLKEQLGGAHENVVYLQPQTLAIISDSDNTDRNQEYIISYYTYYEKALIEYYYNNISRNELERILNFFKKYFLLRICLNQYKLLENAKRAHRAELLAILNLNALPDVDISNIANNMLDDRKDGSVDDYFRHRLSLSDIDFFTSFYSQTPLLNMFSKIELIATRKPKITGLPPDLIAINEMILSDMRRVDNDLAKRSGELRSRTEIEIAYYNGNRLTWDLYHKQYLPEQLRIVLARNGILNLNEDTIFLFKKYYKNIIDQKFYRNKIIEEIPNLRVLLAQINPPAAQTTPTFTDRLEVMEPDYFSNYVENINLIARLYGI